MRLLLDLCSFCERLKQIYSAQPICNETKQLHVCPHWKPPGAPTPKLRVAAIAMPHRDQEVCQTTGAKKEGRRRKASPSSKKQKECENHGN